MTRRIPPPGEDVVIDVWRRAGGRTPEAVEPVGSQRKKKSVLYRLVRSGEGGRSVVAKLCRGRNRHVERHVYENVLPELPIQLPGYYGSTETEDGIWLFMDDGGTTRCDPANPVHRLLAARWLADLHGAGEVRFAAELPDRGPAHHLERLRSGRCRIREGYGNPLFDADHRQVLDAMLALLDRLEARWNEIEEACAELPQTLVHGDFCPKNLHVVSRDGGLELFPMDWEMAGWGIPACDLFPRRRSAMRPICDLDVYAAESRAHWPRSERSLRRCVALGAVFRTLCSVDWASVDLPHGWPERPISELRIYNAALTLSLRESKWTL